MKKLFDLHFGQGEDIELSNTGIGEILLSVTADGRFEGAEIKGKVVPVGMGITTSLEPGKNNTKSPMLLRTDDGADILMEVDAIFDIEYEKEKRMEEGQYVSPDEYYYKGTVNFQTGSEKYKWLERKICVCTLEIVDWSNLKMEVFLF